LAFSTRDAQAPALSQPARSRGLRTAAALACGGLSGVVLVEALALINPFPGDADKVPFLFLFLLTLPGYVVGALIVICICLPIWTALSKVRRTTFFDAIILGYLATAIVNNLPVIMVPIANPSILKLIGLSAWFGLAGAVAGAITWAVGHSRAAT
jgi:hypothetical protein